MSEPKEYDYLESLKRECERFKTTNRFDPLTATQVFVQAALCVGELEMRRARMKHYEGMEREFNHVCECLQESMTKHDDGRMLGERLCCAAKYHLDRLDDSKALGASAGEKEGKGERS